MLRTAINLGLHPFGFHFAAQVADKLIDVMFAVDAALVQQFGNALVLGRVQVAEAVILQLPFELANAETVGERSVDVGTLFRRQHAFIFRRVFHFAQVGNALGELNHHAAEIIDHGQQHAAHVVDLFGGYRVGMRRLQLTNRRHIAHAVNQGNDRFSGALAEHFFTHHVSVD